MSTAQATLRGINTLTSFQQTLDFALRRHPDTVRVLLTGDIAEEPAIITYQSLVNILKNYSVDFNLLPGNHDIYADMLAVLNQPHYNCEKRLLLNHWQVLMLNSQIPGSAEGALATEEIEFVKHNLEHHPQHHTLIAIHHHCQPTDSVWMDTMLLKNQQEFIDLIQQYPQVKGVIMGHIHQELEQTNQHIQYLGTPSTCFQFTPQSEHFAIDHHRPGYRWLKLHANGVFESGVDYLPDNVNH